MHIIKTMLVLLTMVGLAVASFVLFHAVFTFSPCDHPLQYTIVSIDPRFNLTKDQLKEDLKQAEDVWEPLAQKNVFEYSDKAVLKISLVYDRRQALTGQITSLEDQLQSKQSTYQQMLDQYTQQSALFESRLKAYNDTVKYWNSHGGAPADQYQQLQQQKEDLHKLADAVNALGAKVNKSADQFNGEVDQLNQVTNQYNQTLSATPEEGLYSAKDNSIEIYRVKTKDELVHTLAHEMGHALGMQHVRDKEGIMYAATNTNLTPTTEDKDQLDQACAPRNWQNTLRYGLQQLKYAVPNQTQ